MLELTERQKSKIALELVRWDPAKTSRLVFIETIEEIVAEHPDQPTYSATLPRATEIVDGFSKVRALLSIGGL